MAAESRCLKLVDFQYKFYLTVVVKYEIASTKNSSLPTPGIPYRIVGTHFIEDDDLSGQEGIAEVSNDIDNANDCIAMFISNG